MARLAPADPYIRLASKEEQAVELPDLELFDSTEFTTEMLTEMALKCEDSALGLKGITNSDSRNSHCNQHWIYG